MRFPENLQSSVFRSDYDELLNRYFDYASSLWKSDKAIIEGRLTWFCGVLPEKMVLGREIFKASDASKIYCSIIDGLKSGYTPGIRTCYKPQIPKSPWVMGLNTVDKVESFFTSVYPDWMRNQNLSEIIVMRNLPGLGEHEYDKQHYVFRVEEDDLHHLSVEMRLGTPQLRSLESDTLRQDIISVTLQNGFCGFYHGQITFGGHYCNTNDKDFSVEFLSPHSLMYNENLQSHVDFHTFLVVSQTLKYLEECYVDPSIRLGERLQSFRNRGLEFCEWQGRYGDDGVKWLKIYGVRGTQDEGGWVNGGHKFIGNN